MIDLRQFFIVDELQQTALQGDEKKLSLLREIIRRIKLSQLDAKQVADNDMIIEVLNALLSDLKQDITHIEHYLEKTK